jgi:predicted metal-dependent phosphoesterase TrpH
MQGKIDLHIHTTCSDGFYTPEEIVEKAKELNLTSISITDHDSVDAIKRASEYAKKLGIEVISGVELSSDFGENEVHILAYFIDLENEELERYLQFFRTERLKRAERIIKKLNNLGFGLTMDDIILKAKNSAIGRPHIAQALLEKEYVRTYYEAFNKYIGNGCPAYEKKVHISPRSAFKIINDAGGLSFIAHPGFMKDNVLKELIEAGVDGIEVIHPSHNHQLIKFYRGIVNEYFLLESGGSDFHGGKRDDHANLGSYFVSPNVVDAMKKRLQKNNSKK